MKDQKERSFREAQRSRPQQAMEMCLPRAIYWFPAPRFLSIFIQECWHCTAMVYCERKGNERERVYRFLHPKKQKRREETSTVHYCHISFFPSSSLCHGNAPYSQPFSFLFLYYYCCFHSTPFLAEFSFEPICIEPLSDLAFQCSAQLIAPSL